MHFLHTVSLSPPFIYMHARWAVAPRRVSCDESDVSLCVFVTDQLEDGNQTKMVVGVVVGLLVATVVIGMAYWVYMKKAK